MAHILASQVYIVLIIVKLFYRRNQNIVYRFTNIQHLKHNSNFLETYLFL